MLVESPSMIPCSILEQYNRVCRVVNAQLNVEELACIDLSTGNYSPRNDYGMIYCSLKMVAREVNEFLIRFMIAYFTFGRLLSKLKSLNSLNFHSLGSDVSDHFFWSEYRVDRTRFPSLSSEFSLYRS